MTIDTWYETRGKYLKEKKKQKEQIEERERNIRNNEYTNLLPIEKFLLYGGISIAVLFTLLAILKHY